MKLLSIAIPCYNSQDYMEHAIDSLLPGGDEVEILIVDEFSAAFSTPTCLHGKWLAPETPSSSLARAPSRTP